MKFDAYTSWGGYPYFLQTPHACYWRENIQSSLLNLKNHYTTTLAFGNGRSYGDSCLAASNHILHTRSLDRFIHADWQTGIVRAEAGMTLAELLAICVPRGWFLPVTPGTKFVTLGGALANDVHGKNHHQRGTFGCHIERFGLIRSDQGYIVCSREENPDLFAATIGGLGLTGIIEWLEIKLMPIHSTQIDTTQIRFNSLSEFFDLSAELDSKYEYSVSWIDCLATGKSVGRGVFTVGNHALQGGLQSPKKNNIQIPLRPPISFVNKLSLKILNNLYYHLHKSSKQHKTEHYDPFFYPLDRILGWNKIYGPKGFQQYQCVIPENTAKAAIQELLKLIAQHNSGSFLAVLKRCGNIKSPGWLSFPMPGISLALDFPHNKKNNDLLLTLDNIVKAAGGRLYPAKDAHMSGESFRHFYPEWQKIEALRDPALLSHFWRRVTL